MADENKSGHLLVIIIDTNPVWWGKFKDGCHLTISQCLNNVMAFGNAHLIMNQNNKLAIVAAHKNQCKFLHPRHHNEQRQPEQDFGDQSDQIKPSDGKYELLTQMNDATTDELKQLILDADGHEFHADTVIAGALGKTLCYANRLERACGYGETLKSRVLVVKGAEDNPSQYMNFMNAVFTAQKLNIVIDTCILDHPSSLLQQASDLTGGVYLKVPQLAGLLQYLLWVFLPDAETRAMFTTLPQTQVDYRAACFCHRNMIDIGYVCSVCLSIFCSFSPICSTCHTHFRIMTKTKFNKKKKKIPKVLQ